MYTKYKMFVTKLVLQDATPDIQKDFMDVMKDPSTRPSEKLKNYMRNNKPVLYNPTAAINAFMKNHQRNPLPDHFKNQVMVRNECIDLQTTVSSTHCFYINVLYFMDFRTCQPVATDNSTGCKML